MARRLSDLGSLLASPLRQMERVAEARTTRLSLDVLVRSLTLNRFAQAVLTRYAQAKQARGWLDFDDLILLPVVLLQRDPEALARMSGHHETGAPIPEHLVAALLLKLHIFQILLRFKAGGL